jgi:hypothetical protein
MCLLEFLRWTEGPLCGCCACSHNLICGSKYSSTVSCGPRHHKPLYCRKRHLPVRPYTYQCLAHEPEVNAATLHNYVEKVTLISSRQCNHCTRISAMKLTAKTSWQARPVGEPFYAFYATGLPAPLQSRHAINNCCNNVRSRGKRAESDK